MSLYGSDKSSTKMKIWKKPRETGAFLYVEEGYYFTMIIFLVWFMLGLLSL